MRYTQKILVFFICFYSKAVFSDSSRNVFSELSSRVQNAFRNENIATIDELAGYTESELMRINGFGRKSFDEVKEFLAQNGLKQQDACKNLF